MPKRPPKPMFGTRRGNGNITLAGVDGRSLLARRFREITTNIEADLGGDLTEAQNVILARAATLACWAEGREEELAKGEPFDAASYATASNTVRRLLSDLGLKRVSKDISPTLHSYLAKKGRANA